LGKKPNLNEERMKKNKKILAWKKNQIEKERGKKMKIF
jgi:hypothetical protein